MEIPSTPKVMLRVAITSFLIGFASSTISQESPDAFLEKIVTLYRQPALLASPQDVAQMLGAKFSEKPCISSTPPGASCGVELTPVELPKQLLFPRRQVNGLVSVVEYRISDSRDRAILRFFFDQNEACFPKASIERLAGVSLEIGTITAPLQAPGVATAPTTLAQRRTYGLEGENGSLVFHFAKGEFECATSFTLRLKKIKNN